MICENCNTELEDNAKFCTKCGRKFNSTEKSLNKINTGMSSVGSFLKRILPIVMVLIIVAVAIGLFQNYQLAEKNYQLAEKTKQVKAEEKLAEQYSSNHYYNDGKGIGFLSKDNYYINLVIKTVNPETIIVNGEAFMRGRYDDGIYEFNDARLKVFFDYDLKSFGSWDITMIQYRPDFSSDFKTYYNKDLVRK